jgi:glycosyltransferase domain-containing protein
MQPSPPAVTILIPTRNRPLELARLIRFLSVARNPCPVCVLDGSNRDVQAENAAMLGRVDFATHAPYDPELHLGLRCADGLRRVTTPYVVLCGDDDFVFPEALAACAGFLDAHADHSAVSGNFLSLNYLADKPLFRHGILLKNSFRFIGYTAHRHFLQRALYAFAYSYLGTPPLYYALRRIGPAREAFDRMTAEMKYSGVELLSNSMALIRGKVAVLEIPFGLRDYSAPTIREPERDNPGSYLAAADIEFIRPILVAALAEQESLPDAAAARDIDLYLTQWQPPDWEAPHLRTATFGFPDRIRMARGLFTSMLAPDSVAAAHGLAPATMRALLRTQREFVDARSARRHHR